MPQFQFGGCFKIFKHSARVSHELEARGEITNQHQVEQRVQCREVDSGLIRETISLNDHEVKKPVNSDLELKHLMENMSENSSIISTFKQFKV